MFTSIQADDVLKVKGHMSALLAGILTCCGLIILSLVKNAMKEFIEGKEKLAECLEMHRRGTASTFGTRKLVNHQNVSLKYLQKYTFT